MDEQICGCGATLSFHCSNPACQWYLCHPCQVIISETGAIPTWERYVSEGRDT